MLPGATRKGLAVHPATKGAKKKFFITHVGSGLKFGPAFPTIHAECVW
jgi:hypothetical protein